jgi:hypothetical protein
MERKRNAYIFWLETLKEGDHSEVLSIDGRIRLKLILNRMEWWGTGFVWFGTGLL